MSLDGNNSLFDWLISHSAASRVFIDHNLNFCTYGEKTLNDICEENGLQSELIMNMINERSNKTCFTNTKATQLPHFIIEEILIKYHTKHRHDLLRLIALAKKVESVHEDAKDCPHGLCAFLETLYEDLDSHMKKEENILFPLIKNGQGSFALRPINVMMFEHGEHLSNLRGLRRLTNDFNIPEDACGSWRALYDGVSTLERELMEHMALEDYLLFPKALNDNEV